MGDHFGKYSDLKDIDVVNIEENGIFVPLEKFEEGAVEITKCVLMDAIISLVTGYNSIPEHEMKKLKAIMSEEPRLYRTAYPFEDKVSLEMSGFVNSFMVRYPDWGDTMRLPAARTGSGGHPNDGMGAVFTLMDVPGITGKEILELIRLSYELWGIFHSQMMVNRDGFDPASVMSMSVPVLAAVAFHAEPQRRQNAMNLGATLLGMLGNTRYAGGGGIKNMKNAACGCQIYKGLWAYRMSDLVECTNATFTAPDGWYENIAPFTGEFKGISDMEVYGPLEMKVWPIYNVAQAPVDCAVAMYDAVKDRLNDIEKINLYKTKKDIIKIATKMENRFPQNHAQADHSPFWGAAIGLKYGLVGLHHFEDKYYKDEDVCRMLSIMECIPFDDKELEELGGAVSASALEVIFKDGTSIKESRSQHGGAFSGMTLVERAKRMQEIVEVKRSSIEKAYGCNLTQIKRIVDDMEHQSGAALLDALHDALKH